MHSLPYWYGTRTDEVGYFRDVVRTYPQIKVQPPYKATIRSLEALARDMDMVSYCLGSMLPRYQEKEGDPPGPHPEWANASQFPWPDKFQRKAAGWNRKQDLLRGST